METIMTIGIYKLKFHGTDKCYIGQSVNIEKRYREHINNMQKGVSKPKLQQAYNIYGVPVLEVLLETTIDTLDSAEMEAIAIFDSVSNGFNTLSYPGNPDVRGVDSCHAKLDRATYLEIFRLLADTDMCITDIADALDTTRHIVSAIFTGRTHQWLYEEDPARAKKILEKRKIGRYFTKCGTDRALVSPTGVIYHITNIRAFCREHNINPGHISSVLVGTRKSHLGWTKYSQQGTTE